MTSEQKAQIARLREVGYGYATIAEALSLTKNQVSAFCRRNLLIGAKSTSSINEIPDASYCRCCGKALMQIAKRKPLKFCSADCRVRWWNTHQEKVNRRAFYPFVCACCGKAFTAYGNAHRKYCSRDCYIADRFKGGVHND